MRAGLAIRAPRAAFCDIETRGYEFHVIESLSMRDAFRLMRGASLLLDYQLVKRDEAAFRAGCHFQAHEGAFGVFPPIRAPA